LVSPRAKSVLTAWLVGIMDRANFLSDGRFLTRSDFKAKGFLGGGGIARFRDTLWAGLLSKRKLPRKMKPGKLADLASESRESVRKKLASHDD
jgi:hypothetical protein